MITSRTSVLVLSLLVGTRLALAGETLGEDTGVIKIGDVGYLGNETKKVTQVIDDNNALVRINFIYGYDDQKLLGTEIVWMQAPTKNLVDGHTYKDSRKFEVVGTKRYESAAGSSKTVYRLKLTDKDTPAEADYKLDEKIALMKKKIDESNEKKRKALDAAEEEAKWRKWTDSRIEAKFCFMISNRIKLTKRNGSVIWLGSKDLSEQDRKWIEEYKKSKR